MLKPYFGGLRYEVAMFWVLETSTNNAIENSIMERKKRNLTWMQNKT
jgi:hypothetical protein